MPRWLLAMLLVAFPGAGALMAQNPGTTVTSSRLTLSLNDGWRFLDADATDAARPDYADGSWVRVNLPHTWNAADALVKTQPYRRGVGWYRRTLELPGTLQGQRLVLRFEGANQVADVFVNGRPAGHHVGGYTAFAVDVTGLVAFDRPNVVAVRVDNSPNLDIPPLSADFTFYGGLYRNVWLIAADPLHVDLLDHGGPGVYVDAPGLTAARAAVRVRGTVVNDGPAAVVARVASRVIDPEGREVAAVTSRLRIAAGRSAAFEQTTPPIASPHLWSPEQPQLYAVRTEIFAGDRLADRVESPLGLRWYSWDAQKGFSLNGTARQLHGTNRHQDFRGLGNAVPDELQRRDLRIIKGDGFDFVRLAHYPQAPAVLDEADRLGLAVWEEIPVVNRITLSEGFGANAESMLTEMIRQHYNHPSVLFWGYMNEVMLRPPEPLPPGYPAAVAALARRLNDRAHAEDATRPTVMAVFANDNLSPTLHAVPDILGLNLYFGWYYGELPAFGRYVDSLHAGVPARPLMISEYGAGGDDRIHARAPVPFDFSTEYEQVFHEATFPQILQRPWLLGSALWNQFDFGSWDRNDAQPNVNDKGLYRFDRAPKDVSFYYAARLRADPVLHIAAHDWTARAGSTAEDRQQAITVYSNADEVELSLDGRSVGRAAPRDGVARFTVTFHDGANRLEAHGARGGRPVSDVVVVRYADRSPLVAGAPVATAEIAVNAGSATEYRAAAGSLFEPDRAYRPGGWGYVGGSAVGTHERIFDTADDPLVQTTRQGATAYRFDLPDGHYEVELRFAEIERARAGQRVFDVRVNGTAVAAAVDLAGSIGPFYQWRVMTRVDAIGGKGVVVELVPRAGATTISALRVRRL